MASFNDLGLREELASALEEQGIERPTALQQALIPVLRREGNVVARAGSGSGKTLAYGLGIIDRLTPAERDDEGDEEEGEPASGGTRMLVLTPTVESAESAALTLVPLAHAAGLTVSASGPGWGTGAGDADILAATPGQVMQSVRSSGVKLEGVVAVVVDGASEIESLGGWEALETLFDNVPRDAQRVLLTTEVAPGVEDLVDRRIKRALRYPATPAVPVAEAAATGVVGYVIVTEREKLETVARVLGGEASDEAPPAVVCGTDERAAQVAEALALRGFVAGDLGDEGIDVAVVGLATALDAWSEEPAGGTVISYDVPPDEAALKALHGGEITGFALTLPRELAHLRQVSARAGLEARPAGLSGDAPAGQDDVRTFRDMLRRAVRQEDLGAQMLVLEPLFEDFTPAEVAAAAAALLRRRAPVTPQPSESAAQPAAAPRRPAAERSSTAGAAPAAYARLYVGVGERDGVRAGDLVGAIAGESDIPGTKVGRIEVRDTFSIVEVPAELAEHIIASVNGTTIKGRAARVDHDRGNAKRGPGGPRGEGSRGPARGGRDGGGGRGGPPRRTFREPPRDRE